MSVEMSTKTLRYFRCIHFCHSQIYLIWHLLGWVFMFEASRFGLQCPVLVFDVSASLFGWAQ